MKVLLANSTCKLGGVSTFMLALRSALVSLGHECELFFFEHGPMEPNLPPDARVHFGSLADCLRLVAREGIDVVHANNIDWTTGISACRNIGARLILTAHKARPSAWTYGWTSATCDALTTVSIGLCKELQPYTDVPIQVVWNGIDTQQYTPFSGARTSPPIVAWVGRSTSPLKALDRFAGVAPALRDAGMRVWILDQHGLDRFAQLNPAAATMLSSVAEIWLAVAPREMPRVYRDVAASGGCIVSTSSREGLGLALLEAQACGCVAIGPDVSAINEAISPDHGGVLYPSETSSTDLARLVVETVRDAAGMRARARQAAGYVRKHFSVERMAAQYLEIYQQAPVSAPGDALTRARARLRLSPMLHWKEYLDQRWGVAFRQYATACELLAAGEQRLAAAAARASVQTGPTLYINPQRLACLLRAMTASDARPTNQPDRSSSPIKTRQARWR